MAVQVIEWIDLANLIVDLSNFRSHLKYPVICMIESYDLLLPYPFYYNSATILFFIIIILLSDLLVSIMCKWSHRMLTNLNTYPYLTYDHKVKMTGINGWTRSSPTLTGITENNNLNLNLNLNLNSLSMSWLWPTENTNLKDTRPSVRDKVHDLISFSLSLLLPRPLFPHIHPLPLMNF